MTSTSPAGVTVDRPSWYVVSSEDRAVSVDLQRELATRLKARTTARCRRDRRLSCFWRDRRMKVYFASLDAGLLVGVVHNLLDIRSPVPPVVALPGEQLLPVALWDYDHGA